MDADTADNTNITADTISAWEDTPVTTVLLKNGIALSVIREVAGVMTDLELLDSVTEFTPLKRGMTNQLFFFAASGEKYLLRLSGQGTEHIINRTHEAAVYQALEGRQITEDVLYLNPGNGIKISRYLSEAHPCDSLDPEEVKRCMQFLKGFHSEKLQVAHAFDIYAEIRLYESQCGICHGAFPDCLETREHIMSLRDLIGSMECKDRLCHIDPVYDNFLINGSTHLIDWEYAGMCDFHIDIAMFCIYAGYDKETTDRTIQAYFEGQASDDDRMLIYAYMAAGAYLWVLWCEIKKNSGVDYSEYEADQYRLSKEFYRHTIELYRKK